LVLVAWYFFYLAVTPGAEPCYVRELPLPVHTKFVEEHEAVLTALLRQLIPTYLNEASRTFAARLRLREPEPLVYVRVLDPQLSAGLSFGLSEFMVPLSKFQDLQPPGHTVLITENKITFLTLPALAGAVAVWGQGFAVGLVEHAAWLQARQVFYWGDLDAAGLQILNRLRRYCPAARPLLMDAATLAQYQQFQVRATPVAAAVLQHLTPAEQALSTTWPTTTCGWSRSAFRRRPCWPRCKWRARTCCLPIAWTAKSNPLFCLALLRQLFQWLVEL
jgi:hypothetical protein